MRNLTRMALSAVAALAATIATPSHAALVPATTACALTDITPNALACTGFYQSNLINNSPTDIADQITALGLLGFTWDGDYNAAEKIENLNGSHTVDFATPLNGISYVAFHFGNGGVPGQGGATAFYKLDALTNLDTIGLYYNASSNAILYSTGGTPGVPEPATWAMMIAGFGMVGGAMRRRQNQTVRVHHA